jgi:hypothetical protein
MRMVVFSGVENTSGLKRGISLDQARKMASRIADRAQDRARRNRPVVAVPALTRSLGDVQAPDGFVE